MIIVMIFFHIQKLFSFNNQLLANFEKDINKNYNKKIINRWNNISKKLILKKNFNTVLKQLRWKKNYDYVMEEMNNKFIYKNIIKQINSNKNYFYWKKENELVKHLKNFKVVIINLECFYSYYERKMYNSYYLNNILKYGKLNNIPIYLVGELHPRDIVKHFLKILTSLKLLDYVSPYHYNTKSNKLKNNMIADKPSNPNINKIIKDIITENKLKKKDICYIGNDLTDYQTYKLCFKY